jgi:two-component system OmpR family response regulator
MRILLVEDSPPTRALLKSSLEGAGHSVVLAGRWATGLQAVEGEEFEVIVIDIMLPDGNGLDLCREIRRLGITTPILFLSALGEVGDRVTGLDAGGDDYMRKPFALAELHARIRALTRRQGLSPAVVVDLGQVRIDFGARRLTRDGQDVPLTAREWDVLQLLAARMGRLVSRDEILEIAWRDSERASSESLDVIISRLRRKLGSEGTGGWIRTVRSAGYVLERPQ